MMKAYIKLLRPQQWVKNLFVFLPLFFSGNMTSVAGLAAGLVAFVAFSLAASGIYCLNDANDAEADRLHPVKCRRPVASGAVGVGYARLMSVCLLAASIAVVWLWGSVAGCGVLGAYIVLNLAYCLGLKRVAILDVIIVAVGFVLRVVMGGVMCSVWVSPWIVCMTFLLTLLLAFGKRRDDVVLRDATGMEVRRSSESYNLEYLNQILGLLAAVTVVCYIIYCLTPEVVTRFGSEYLYVTAIFVVAGILRYLQLAIVAARSGSPTRVLYRDRFLQICILCWILTFCAIIYYPRL